jgi:uncharacterized protein (DUF488 family)
MKVYTIGFTKKSARVFFGILGETGARSLVDVRLNNVSQLAGFAKRDDLAYFLRAIVEMDYLHEPLLAPTKDMLDDYKKHGTPWAVYEERFLDLMRERQVEKTIVPQLIDNSVLLCSEEKPHQCHRRLVAEYLSECWGELQIQHLG